MTINKPEPEVVAWRWRKPIVNDQGETIGDTVWELSDAPGFLPWWTNDSLIRLSDYERLQADHERLQAECEKLCKQASAPAPEGAVPQWDGVIKPSDFIVDTFRRGASGWVPKPDNCVRITHRPTGFFEEETAMRSVHANKAVAWQRLSDRLESLAAEPQPPDAAAPVELPKPVGWFHRHPKECKNGEVCNYQIAPADRKDGWEEFPLYTEQQVRTLLAEVSAPAAQADAKDAARYRWLRDNDWKDSLVKRPE